MLTDREHHRACDLRPSALIAALHEFHLPAAEDVE
jgi:hypothetical protein